MLTQERLKELLHYSKETGVFTRLTRAALRIRVGDVAGVKHSGGYLTIGIAGVNHKAHRLAWLYHYGEPPNGEIDHINCYKTDNRIENLRVVTRNENAQNIHRANITNETGVRGINKRSNGKYRGRFIVDGININVGTFDDLETAKQAVIASKRIHSRSFSG